MLATAKVLFVSALLLLAIPAFAAEESSGVAPVVLPTATVKCPGVTNIPLTVDAEQALPLHLIRTLKCGEVVTILADTEGYTARIRTADGKDGYVPRMYLMENVAPPPAPPAVVHQVSTATPVNGVVRWVAGAPGCDEFMSRGRHVESITANGVTVQVSLQDTGWKYRANVAISNHSSVHVDVTPGLITLDELQPRLRTLPASETKVIARTSTHQVLWTEADAQPSPSAKNSSEHLVAERQRLPYPNDATPDYLNPHLTMASARPSAFAKTEPVDIQSVALKYQTLSEGQDTAGVMWFARDPGAKELSMRVPAGDLVFDFSFSFEQKK